MQKILIGAAFVAAAVVLALITGIGPGPALADSGGYIIDAREVEQYLRLDNTVLVDMQDPEDYAAGHIAGAVNITRNDIVINNPYPNLLAPGEAIEEILGASGIDNETLVLIYDNSNNMNAARLWWTLLVYGHEEAKVISGGFEALKRAGLSVSTEAPAVTAKTYLAPEPDQLYIATIEDIMAQVEDPQDNVVLLDTRSREEHESGTIPGSVLFDYELNIFDDGTFKPVQHILLQYKEKGITADQDIIIYCAVSVRGAQTFLALYNAGYRNLQLYDAAWVEYSDLHQDECAQVDADVPVEEEIEEEEVEEQIEAPGG